MYFKHHQLVVSLPLRDESASQRAALVWMPWRPVLLYHEYDVASRKDMMACKVH